MLLLDFERRFMNYENIYEKNNVQALPITKWVNYKINVL